MRSIIGKRYEKASPVNDAGMLFLIKFLLLYVENCR